MVLFYFRWLIEVLVVISVCLRIMCRRRDMESLVPPLLGIDLIVLGEQHVGAVESFTTSALECQSRSSSLSSITSFSRSSALPCRLGSPPRNLYFFKFDWRPEFILFWFSHLDMRIISSFSHSSFTRLRSLSVEMAYRRRLCWN